MLFQPASVCATAGLGSGGTTAAGAPNPGCSDLASAARGSRIRRRRLLGRLDNGLRRQRQLAARCASFLPLQLTRPTSCHCLAALVPQPFLGTDSDLHVINNL